MSHSLLSKKQPSKLALFCDGEEKEKEKRKNSKPDRNARKCQSFDIYSCLLCQLFLSEILEAFEILTLKIKRLSFGMVLEHES